MNHQSLADDQRRLYYIWTAWKEIPAQIPALITSEDATFLLSVWQFQVRTFAQASQLPFGPQTLFSLN